MLIPSLIAAASLCVPKEPQGPPSIVVYTEFGDDASALLRTAILRRGDAAVDLRARTAEEILESMEEVAREIGESANGTAYALIGYPLPLLIALEERLPLSASPGLATAREAFRSPSSTIEGLWLDPVGIAMHKGAQGRPLAEDEVADLLPSSFDELGRGKYEGLLILERPRAFNATGALLTRLSTRMGGVRSAEDVLEGVDANVHAGYALDRRSVLDRLTSGRLLFGVTTLRSVLFFQAGGPELRFHPIEDEYAAVVLGAVVSRGPTGPTARLWDVLNDPDCVLRISVVEHLVPVGPGYSQGQVPAWAAPYRARLAGIEDLLAREARIASGVVRVFERDIQGEFARRRERFSEYYDAIGIALIAAIVVWMLRGSGGARAPRSRSVPAEKSR